MSYYTDSHFTLRRRMFQMAYHNTHNEDTSVRFSLNGLEGHPTYLDVTRAIDAHICSLP